jgi:hypothetical protein
MWDYVVNLDSKSYKIAGKTSGYHSSYTEWREIVLAMAHSRGLGVWSGRSNITPATLARMVPPLEQLSEFPDDVRNWLFWWVKHVRYAKLRRRGPLLLLSHHLRNLAMIKAGNYDGLRKQLNPILKGAQEQRRTRRYKQQASSKAYRAGRRFE